jgi:hypothetical protein
MSARETNSPLVDKEVLARLSQLKYPYSMELVTNEHVLSALREACRRLGSQKAWAERHGFSPAYVTDVLRERRELAGRLLGALGYERVVRFKQMKKG